MRGVPKSGVIRATKGKVILALFLACSALLLAWGVSKVAFREMLETVENISSPNERLRIVNELSRRITGLDQSQKNLAFNDPGKYNSFFKESALIRKELDSLKTLYQGDTVQLDRIASIKKLLRARDKQFVDYLKVREKLVNDQSFSTQLEKFNDMVNKNEAAADSTIVASERRTTTTTVVPTEEKPRSFFGKIFGGKKRTDDENAAFRITNEENVTRDTIALSSEGQIMKDVEKTLRAMEKAQQRKSRTFVAREAVLATANNLLINQMLDIIKKVEQEAVGQIEQNSEQAKKVVSTGIRQMTIIMVVFFLLMVLLLYLILTDITRSNKYRKELEAATEEAEYHGKAKQRFLSNMSHEIRTPLQSIIGYAEMIRNQERPNPKDVDAIYHSSEHLLQIVNEILDYNRLISGKFTFVSQVFDMQALLDEVVMILSPQAEKKALQLRTSFELEDIRYVAGDPFRLKQILFNLLSNAIKFTMEGHVLFGVLLKRQGEQLHFTFRVQDTGIGLTEEEGLHVFNEFEQADAPEKTVMHQAGTGLGLTIVKSLVENQGGRIYLKSKKGQGSNFTFFLTFKKGVEPVELKQQKSLIMPHHGVWVVDDDQLILDLCSMIFKKHQFNYTCFNDPEALLFADWDPKVKYVLMDIRMPKMTGVELCTALRKKVGAAVKIFAMTAQVLPEERESLLAGGFDGLINKPFREVDLLRIFETEAIAPGVEAVKSKVVGAGINAVPGEGAAVSEAEAVSEPEAVSDAQSVVADRNDNVVADGIIPVDQGEIPDFDPSYLEKMTFGDEEQFNKILNRFTEDCQDDQQQILLNLDKGDYDRVSLLLHRLAGRLAQMGSRDLAAEFRLMEISVNESLEEDDFLTDAQHAGIKELCDKLQRLLSVIIINSAF